MRLEIVPRSVKCVRADAIEFKDDTRRLLDANRTDLGIEIVARGNERFVVVAAVGYENDGPPSGIIEKTVFQNVSYASI